MNLDTCTDGQRTIITTQAQPLMVSAGAGSGKTFTLTQRIAYALSEPTHVGKPFCSGIDEVMAITFTNKAAAELKSRIKHELVAIGMPDEALKVDDAWISTIHGMCQRVLREHSLELGLDPAFEVIGQTEEDALRAQAFDNVISSINDQGQPALRAFLKARDVTVGSFSSGSLVNLVDAVTERVVALPDGFEAIVLPPVEGNPSQFLRRMMVLGEDFVAALNSISALKATDQKHLDSMETALAKANAYMECDACSDSFEDSEFDAVRYCDVLFSFPLTASNYRTGKNDPQFFQDYRDEYCSIAFSVKSALALVELGQLVFVSRLIQEEYQKLKGPGKLDNNDLLTQAYHALVDNPQLASAYRDRFKLIMIDEFQDTDELQVALIGSLAQPGLANVCTVGDAQQSIYRFRGADVNVFFDYREKLKALSTEAKFVNLPDNFRSHADVLSLVDAIFSQDQVFGDEFLRLEPKGAVNSFDDPVFVDRPRIGVALFDCRRGGRGEPSGHLEDGRALCAKRIAQHFAELRDSGVSPSDMVLLLGKTSNAGLYHRALLDAGFECLLAGGSTFSSSDEVGLFQAVLRYFRNPLDSDAAYQVLDSPLFNLGDQALLFLATRETPRGLARRSISEGMFAWRRERGLCGLSEEDVDAVDFALLCLSKAKKACMDEGLCAGVRTLLRATGYYLRLEGQGAEGQAVVGNLAQALNMLSEVEQRGLGLAGSVEAFCADIAALKIKPGSLSTTSSDFVRIMTIHASKGLQFDHVAVAEFLPKKDTSPIVVENIKGMTYVALKPSAISSSTVASKAFNNFEKWVTKSGEDNVSPLEAETVEEGMRALKRHSANQSLGEARRLLYVALTRAVKSLFIGTAYSGKKDGGYDGILDDLHQALHWECSEEAPRQMVNFGGSTPAPLEFTVLREPLDIREAEKCDSGEFLIPSAPVADAPFYTVPQPVTRDTFSSTALHEDDVYDEESLVEDEMQRSEDEDPFALGNAFHRLAQRAVLEFDGSVLKLPSEEAVAAQITQQHVSEQQAVRLRGALQRWFGSAVAQQLVAHGAPHAEVPFMLQIIAGGKPVYLEGEIDAVSFDEAGNAFLVDYKTGGFASETDVQLHAKHLQQAQCYALALLKQGSPSVKATFVRVEHDDPAAPGQPQTVVYEFTSEDSAELEAGIAAAYLRSLA